MNPTVRFLAAFLCLSVAAPAAKVRLLAFSRVGDEMEVNIVDPEGKPMSKAAVALPTQQLSAAEEVSGTSLAFTSPGDAKKILGKVTLPAANGEFVLVFLPAAKDSALPYHIDAVSLPESGFGSGDYAFVNYCGSPVGCVVAGKRLVVPQGKSAVYQAAKSGKGPGNRPLVCYRQRDGAWESTPFFSSRIIIQDGVRNLILICLDPRTGEIDFRGIPDFVGQEP